MFEATPLNLRNQRKQALIRVQLAMVTVLLILPVLAIMAVLTSCE